MKALKDLLKNKKPQNIDVSDKDVFYIFQKILKEEYGNVGVGKIKADFFKSGKLFLHAESSAWAAEIFSNRSDIIRKMNEKLGQETVKEIKFK